MPEMKISQEVVPAIALTVGLLSAREDDIGAQNHLSADSTANDFDDKARNYSLWNF